MVADLLSSNGSCYMSAAGVDVTQENLDAGLRFTWPTYRSGTPRPQERKHASCLHTGNRAIPSGSPQLCDLDCPNAATCGTWLH